MCIQRRKNIELSEKLKQKLKQGLNLFANKKKLLIVLIEIEI
jgi:hypothetical protein